MRRNLPVENKGKEQLAQELGIRLGEAESTFTSHTVHRGSEGMRKDEVGRQAELEWRAVGASLADVDSIWEHWETSGGL